MENFRKLFEKLQTEYDCLFEEHTRLSHVFEELQSDNCQLKAKLDAEEVKRGKIEEYKQEMERFSKKVRIGPIRP
jgi:predicted RNase H-like nuclease (RuvC/YqgF family)